MVEHPHTEAFGIFCLTMDLLTSAPLGGRLAPCRESHEGYSHKQGESGITDLCLESVTRVWAVESQG